MGQYTVGRYLYDNGPSTSNEITRRTKDNSASVSQSLTELKKKGLVRQIGDKWKFHPDADEDRLEAIRPTPLSEALEKN
jgi:predicted HTH transcriptional regulator